MHAHTSMCVRACVYACVPALAVSGDSVAAYNAGCDCAHVGSICDVVRHGVCDLDHQVVFDAVHTCMGASAPLSGAWSVVHAWVVGMRCSSI